MNKHLHVLALIAFLCIGTGGVAYGFGGGEGGSVPGAPLLGMPFAEPPLVVKGELVRTDRDLYVIRDTAGKEVRLRVDEATAIERPPHVGDIVEARVAPKDHAETLKTVEPGTAQARSSR